MVVKTAKKKVGEKVVKSLKPVVVVPKNREEAAEFVCQVGNKQRELEAIAANAEGRIAVIQQEVTKKVQPHQEKLDRLVDGLFLFFDAHRVELTKDGARKSVDLGTGTIGEHTNPYKINLSEKVKTVIKNLKQLGLADRFIRTSEEINREAMLKSDKNRILAATVKGVKVVQTIEFFVEPEETLKEVVADEARLKRRYRLATS